MVGSLLFVAPALTAVSFLSFPFEAPVWFYGMDAPGRLIDNSDLAWMVAEALGLDLDRATEHLFVDLDTAGLAYALNLTNSANPHVTTCGDSVVFPIGKDYMLLDGEEMALPGVAVYAPVTGKVYVSSEAIQKARSACG